MNSERDGTESALLDYQACDSTVQETAMADDSGGVGVLGVLVGVMLVIFVGAAVLMASGGRLGNSGPSFTIKMPGGK
jgi:hypothetical protein